MFIIPCVIVYWCSTWNDGSTCVMSFPVSMWSTLCKCKQNVLVMRVDFITSCLAGMSTINDTSFITKWLSHGIPYVWFAAWVVYIYASQVTKCSSLYNNAYLIKNHILEKGTELSHSKNQLHISIKKLLHFDYVSFFHFST